ncbi:threonine dehydratase [Anabaena sp. UHCC 0399]|uniref:threonine dehydratase n=1 Tax=Anabaena sp. UHCC 0399 TaxID=3110238 RepID=UPI002B1F420C|nr:threonine dehydratase [Anabaena sp. UHCC 0399]MEA5567312.1 threonine dehydratase [Anabaena sp. UHCC 0399]
MARLAQVIQNTFIRLVAFLSFFFKKTFDFISSLFNGFANLFGLNKPSYFLESEEVQSTKKYSDQESITTQLDTKPEILTSVRRRPNTKMDYYVKMAREIQNK